MTNPTTTIAPRRSSKRLRSLSVRAAALGGIALLAAACSSGTTTAPAPSAHSKSHKQHGRAATGVVSALSPGSLTLETKGAGVSIVLGTATKYREAGHSVTESALATGEHVHVRLEAHASTPTARVVLILPPTFSGTVSGLGSGGFTLSGAGGATRSVTTTSATKYRSGKTVLAASALHDGEHVRVTGQVVAGGGLQAATIAILAAKRKS